ncbi:MAG: energy-coupling factor transporter transmembrane protein EcfT [Actinobacteria bacterium]|nr:energy-coupling factor transporter transmembrane protein EcfT [Actinomycetota bacterium]
MDEEVLSLSLNRDRVHPFAWWAWSILLAISLFISSDPWYATSLLLASALVVIRFRGDEPWSNSFSMALRFIAVILIIRMMIAILIGVPIPGATLFTLPTLPLPDWIAGIRIGGPVTSERLLSTLGEVMIIVGVVALFGAATSLASPHRSIRALPFSFYQLGLILTVATSIFPQLVASIKRIRVARRLRGQSAGGIRNWRKIAMPLLEDTLERSLDLSAAMESRGFGQRIKRTSYRPDSWGVLESSILASALLSGLLATISAGNSLAMGISGVLAGISVLLPLSEKNRSNQSSGSHLVGAQS